MAIDFATFNSVVAHVIDAGFPVLIRGRHGIGKSEVVYQFASERGLPVVERRASQMTEGDLMGLPSIDGESTRWNAPDWLKEACDNAVVLFLDEVDRATMEVRQGIFELTDSRKLNGWHLHPQTRIFAAVNGGEHSGASSYQVGEMDPAELDRWTVFDVEPTVSDWLDWANGKVDSVVWDFINQNHAHLEHKPDAGGYEPNKVYPSRRSWVRFNETVDTACLLAEPKQNLAPLYNLAAAFLGFEAAVSFRDFVENYERIVTVEDILVHGKVDSTKDFGINDHLALVEKMEASEVLQSALPSEQIQNLADWFVTLPSEVAMKLFANIGASADTTNVIGLHGATASSGKKVQDFIIEIVG
jgi:alkaline phosphatase D